MRTILEVYDTTNGANEQKVALIKNMHRLKIDFRTLNQFKIQFVELV
jgi:hypothetical protein